MKIYSNGPGHMTNMAAMPIYSKNLKKSSSQEPKGQWPWVLVCSSGTQVCSNVDPGLTLTYFTTSSDLVPYAFICVIGKTMDFSEIILVYDIKVN